MHTPFILNPFQYFPPIYFLVFLVLNCSKTTYEGWKENNGKSAVLLKKFTSLAICAAGL
jgi:hypothetical protein